MTVPSSPVVTQLQPDHPAHDATLSRLQAPLRTRHHALGFALQVATNDLRVRDAAVASFGPDRDDRGSAEVSLSVLVHHVPEAVGWAPSQPIVRRHGDMFTIVSSRATAIAGHLPSGTASGFISDQAAASPDFLRWSLLQSAMFGFAEESSITVMHSACILYGQRALLIRGLNGAGKSTLCYAALRRGWSLLAEDVVFVRAPGDSADHRLAPEELRIAGLPWTLHLLPDAVDLFPELRGQPAFERTNGEIKISIEVGNRFPGQAAEVAPLGPLVFVTRGDRALPSLARLPRERALELLRTTAIRDEAEVHEQRGLWDAFLRTPPYLLETGDDPDDNVSALEQLLRHADS
jgi:hypothetical protein